MRKRERDRRLKKMTFAAYDRCRCGAGFAYDDTCVLDPFKHPSYWECSAILLGTADPDVVHSDQMPFVFYSVIAETSHRALGNSTRPGP